MTSDDIAEQHSMTGDDEGQSALDDAFASGRDRGSDFAGPAPEARQEPPKPEPEVKDAAKPAAETKGDDGDPKQYRDPETGRFVPLTELKTERTKRQEEARLRTEAETRAARAEAALEEARRLWVLQQQPQHQPHFQPEQPPDDIWSDPNRFIANHLQAHEQRLRAEFERVRVMERIEDSREQMIAAHKDFEEMEKHFVEAAQSAPHLLQAMAKSRNPAKFAYDTAKRLRFLSDVGQEPDNYVQRIREAERKKVLEELKLGPQTTQRFPGTLADAPAAGTQGRLESEQAMMDRIYSSDRSQRRSV